MSDFKKSQEAAHRRFVRSMIRKGPFTKGERDVTLALVNYWFHHKGGAKDYIHPGRKKLAKKAGVSVRTVASTLALLRDWGAIKAVGHLNGLHGNATEYVVDEYALLAFCDGVAHEQILRLAVNGVQNCTGSGRAKIAHRINNVDSYPNQKSQASNVVQFPKRSGSSDV